MSDELVPRDILTFTVPGGEFRKADYPWLVAVRATVRGGDGGASSDGNLGEAGETISTLLSASDLEDVVPITVGASGKAGGPDSPDGEDGFVMLELFDAMPRE
jgi:hypothetical protein